MANFWKLRLARIAVRRGGFWGIAVTFSVICAIVSGLILFAVTPSLDDEKLQALDSQLLRRAELMADHAIIALVDLFESGSICRDESIEQFRRRYSLWCAKRCSSLRFDPSGPALGQPAGVADR